MKHDRYIMTKRGIVPISVDMVGVPIEQAWPQTMIPSSLKGALIYTIDGREIIAKQGSKFDEE